MYAFANKLLAAGGLAIAALSLVAATGSHDTTLRQRSVGHGGEPSPRLERSPASGTDALSISVPHAAHRLEARQRNRGGLGGGQFRGGGRGNPFSDAIQRARKITDGKLNPGNTGGQRQGAFERAILVSRTVAPLRLSLAQPSRTTPVSLRGGVNNAQGSGKKNLNATSGLPANIVDTGDPQKNLFLDPSQIATGLANNGQAVASATSVNNFINNCLLRTDLPLTNGQQVTGGSCNAVPMGVIAAQNRMPSSKFTNPKNLDVIAPDMTFTIQMAISNLVTGNFVNAQQNYFSAPQATDAQGIITGHSHVVVEQIDSLTSTAVTDPTQFAFFKGLNDPAVNGVLSTTVSGGLPEGVYKMSSINSASNHQPALVGVAQHGSLDDAVYFIASNDPNALQTALGLNANAAAAGSNANGDAGGGNGGTGGAAAASANNAQGQAQNQGASAASGAAQQSNDAAKQGVSAAAASNGGASTKSSAAVAAATTGAAPAAATTSTGPQQQQQGNTRTGPFGGRRGSRGNDKRSEFPRGPPSLLEKRLADLLVRKGAPA
ncbi:hypothetical protein JCM3770_007014 [Rhodotorula araucariae]